MERSSDVSLILLWLFTQSDSPSHPWPSIHPAKRKPSSWRGWGSQWHLLTQPHPLKETSPSETVCIWKSASCVFAASLLWSPNSTTYSCGTLENFLNMQISYPHFHMKIIIVSSPLSYCKHYNNIIQRKYLTHIKCSKHWLIIIVIIFYF